jgi:hypothetical protein
MLDVCTPKAKRHERVKEAELDLGRSCAAGCFGYELSARYAAD